MSATILKSFIRPASTRHDHGSWSMTLRPSLVTAGLNVRSSVPFGYTKADGSIHW